MLQLPIICLWFARAAARLVVDQDFLDNFDSEIVKTEGDLVNTTYREHPSCQNVEEKVETFEFFTLDEEGKEVPNVFELATTIDFIYNTDKIHNFHERWIWGYIYIRLGKS